MTIRKLTDTLSVSPQIAAADLPALHAAGIRAIICNRPDGEGPDQPTVTEIRAAAAPLGAPGEAPCACLVGRGGRHRTRHATRRRGRCADAR